MSDYSPDTTIVEEFKENFGVSGLSDGDFTKTLTLNGATSAIVVTVANITSDRYSVSYTPNAVGHWTVRVWRTAQPTVKYSQTRKVSTPIASQVWDALVSSYTVAGSLGERLNLIYKWLRNKIIKSAASAGTYTLYDDNETTPLATGSFSSTERNPD